MKIRRYVGITMLAGALAATGCDGGGAGNNPSEADQTIPPGAIPAPDREEQPGLGQEASGEPSADTARVDTGAANAMDTVGGQPPR